MRFFIYANICLALFNMLPILPLDGGRILKDVLVSKNGSCQGMQIYKKTVFDIFRLLLLVLGIFSIYNK